jgi:hypothetical protein
MHVVGTIATVTTDRNTVLKVEGFADRYRVHMKIFFSREELSEKMLEINYFSGSQLETILEGIMYLNTGRAEHF